MKYAGIQVWGDSVLKGVVFDPDRKRYVILKESAVSLLERRLGLHIENNCRMGRCSVDGFAALKEKGGAAVKDQLVVMEFGGNDCDFNWAEISENPDAPHTPRVETDRFEDTLLQMGKYVRDNGGTPLLCTLPPLNPFRYFDWVTRDGLNREAILSFLGAPERIYRWQELYSSVILRVAAALGCDCLPIREQFLFKVRGEDVMCLDGIHPNALGHRLMAESVTLPV